jgi:hypothetical protein
VPGTKATKKRNRFDKEKKQASNEWGKRASLNLFSIRIECLS